MKKVVSLVLCLLMFVPQLRSLKAEQEYAAYSSIGYGPLEGEIISPCAIGSDEMGKICVIDKASRKGLIYTESGAYFKTVVVPQAVEMDKLCPNISVNTGMIAYPAGKNVTVASSDGEVAFTCGLGSLGMISKPLKCKLMDNLTVFVLDAKTGLLEYDREGNFKGQKVFPGSIPTAPNLLSFDINKNGEIVLLSITMEMPKEGGEGEAPPEPKKNSIVQFTILDSEFKTKSTFKLATSDAYNPQNGEVSFIDNNKIAFMSNDVTGFVELDMSGNVTLETYKGIIGGYKAFVASKTAYFTFTADEFVKLDKNGTDITTLGKFSNDPMKFGHIAQISRNDDGFAVLDNKRNDIQLFTGKGFSGLKTLTSTAGIILFSNQAGNACIYSNSTKSVRILGTNGSQTSTFTFESQMEALSRIVTGIGEEFLGLSKEFGNVYRINKEGFFILKFGSFGADAGQFTEPVDLLVTLDKSIHVLDSDGMIKVFDQNGKYIRSYGMPDGQKKLSNPESFALLPSGDIMVSDTGNDRLVVFANDGSFKYSMGQTTPAGLKKNIGDYAKDIGTFSHPGQIVVNGQNIYVADPGNMRIQVLRKEKVVPKMTVDRQTIDFGKVTTGMVSEKLVIKNTGNGILEGSAVCDSPWIELSKRTIAGNEVVIEIRCLSDKVPYWNEKPAEIIINTNGGFIKITISATKIGKKVRLQVNSTKAYINDTETTMTVPPSLVGNNTMVPLRFIGEVLEASVDWDAQEKKVTYTLGSKQVICWIGRKEAIVDGKTMVMTASPVIVSGKTLVPLRFIGEALGATVEWVAESKTILIYYPPK